MYESLQKHEMPVTEYMTEAGILKGLQTIWLGKRIYAFGRLKSTNRYAFHVADSGAGEGTVVLADEQTAGRGRLGRTWYSPPGFGLWCSVILRPRLFPWEAPKLTQVASLAVVRAIERTTGVTASLKWPNDVLMGGRKVCGILTELKAEADSVDFIVLGIGLNVKHSEADFPADLRETATSLHLETGRSLSRIAVVQALFAELELAYDVLIQRGFSTLRDEIVEFSCLVNKTVAVRNRNRIYTGRVMDIDREGALVLKVGEDRVEHIISGEICLREG